MLYFNQSVYIHSHIETPHGPRAGRRRHLAIPAGDARLNVFCRGWWNPWGHHFDRWGQSFVTDGAGSEGINYVLPRRHYHHRRRRNAHARRV